MARDEYGHQESETNDCVLPQHPQFELSSRQELCFDNEAMVHENFGARKERFGAEKERFGGSRSFLVG